MNKKKVVSVNLEEEQIEALIALEKKTGDGFQTSVRKAIRLYLKSGKVRKEKERFEDTNNMPTITEDSLLTTAPAY